MPATKVDKRANYFERLIDLCVNSPAALFVEVDHVSSKQLQEIRTELRGKAEVLMGKNTRIRKALDVGMEQYPDSGLDMIKAAVGGNVGFIFATNCTLDEIREVLEKHKKPAAAKPGQISLVDYTLKAGATNLDPQQTSFFQALNIGTKIVKGQIELTHDYNILKIGEEVTASSSALLTKLNIKPFEYKVHVKKVFQDKCVFAAEVLDIADDALIASFLRGMSNVAAVSREIGVPTQAGLPYILTNAMTNVAALALEMELELDA